MEYKVVWGKDEENLAIKVIGFLNEGWVLAGGVAVSVSSSSRVYHQAIVRKDSKPREGEKCG